MSTTIAIMDHETAETLGICDSKGLQLWFKENQNQEVWEDDWVIGLFTASLDRFLGTLSKGEIFNLEIGVCRAAMWEEDWTNTGTISTVVRSNMGWVGESIKS